MSNLEQIVKTKLKLFNYAIGDILRAIRGGSLMGAWILSFCVVDYLSHIASLTKNPDDIKNNYKEFVNSYLNGYDDEKIYAIRCALVHTYGTSRIMKDANLNGYSFTHKNPQANKIYFNGVYHLNLSNFIFDLIKGTYIFFTNLENKPEQELKEYVERSKEFLTVFGPLGEQYFLNYGAIDLILSCLDSKDINWSILENEIYKLCLSK